MPPPDTSKKAPVSFNRTQMRDYLHLLERRGVDIEFYSDTGASEVFWELLTTMYNTLDSKQVQCLRDSA